VTPVSSYSLAVDFGTSFTVAAIANGDGPRLVDVEGDGSCRLPSAVWLDDDGGLVVGNAARHQSVFAPDRYEPTPKRVVGEGDVLLGDRLVPVAEVVAAVLRRAGTEADRVAGGRQPARVVLTHPAEWGAARLDTLRKAAEQAGWPDVELVEEPVAAAVRIGASRLGPGEHVAVYDFGGGTFDVAVLRRSEDGFDVAGPPGGRDPLGGEDIDQRIVEHLGAGPLGEDPDWPNLLDPPDVRWRRAASGFRAEVRRAKEGLSAQLAWQLWVPGLEREVQFTRDELEELIASDVEATLDVLAETIAAAGLEPSALAGIYLVGGSSRIPMIADRVWERFAQRPSVQDDPKTVVALGATAWRAQQPAVQPRPPQPGPARVLPEPSPDSSEFVSRLAMVTHAKFWTSGVSCYGYLTVTTPDGARLTVADEPDPGGIDGLVAARGKVLAEQPGFVESGVVPAELFGEPALERRFSVDDVAQVERYAIVAGRATTAGGTQEGLHRLEAVTLVPPRVDPARFYQLPYAVSLDGAEVYERLELVRHRSGHRVTAEGYPLAAGTTLPEWSDRRAGVFTVQPGHAWQNRAGAKVLPSPESAGRLGLFDGIPAVVHTFRVADGSAPRLTRVWVAVNPRRGYSIVATLPESERLGFRLLVAHVVLVPTTQPRSA
jgi:actin-like ATPase involved in cell morphogenesis